MKVFLSVGKPSNAAQKTFIDAVEALLRRNGMEPLTPGYTKGANKQPLKAIEQCMRSCGGIVVVALERLHIDSAVERRGGPDERSITNENLPTPWNQVEGAMAYTLGLPLLVVAEKGLRNELLLEDKYDWNIQRIELDPAALGTPIFQDVFDDWKAQVVSRGTIETTPTADAATQSNLDKLTIGQIFGRLKPAQAWGGLVVAAGIATTALGTAYKLGQRDAAAAQVSAQLKDVQGSSTKSPGVSAAAGAPQANANAGNVDLSRSTSGIIASEWVSDSLPLLVLDNQVSIAIGRAGQQTGKIRVSVSARGGDPQVFEPVGVGEQRSFVFRGKEYLIHVLAVRPGMANVKVVQVSD